MSSNILEEYLVKIGALADARSFQNAQNLVNGLSGSLQTLGNILRFGGIAGMFAGIVKGITDQIKSVAELDTQYQKLAKDMWVTKQTAKQLNIIKDVMKASENDIAFIPELREQFMRLRAEMQALAVPPDADDQLKWIRSIGFEVERLQVKLKMFREWLVYYLIKYLGPYIKQFQDFLKWLNTQFSEKITVWANNLAFILARVIGLLANVGRLVKSVVGGLEGFFDNFPDKTKKMVALFAAAGAAIMMGPFGLVLAAIGGAMILLEDFFGYLDGKKSSRTMAPIWAALVKFANGSGSEFFERLKKRLADIYDILGKIVNELKIVEIVSSVATGVGDIVDGIFTIAKAIDSLMMKLVGGKSGLEGFFKNFAKGVSESIIGLGKLASATGKIFKAVGQALQGNFLEAWETLKTAVKDAVAGGEHGSAALRSMFGGSNQEKTTSKTPRLNTSDEKYSSNTIAREAARAAKWVEDKTGVSADLVYAQWAHESNNFSSRLATENLNLGGLTQSTPNGEENKQPDGNNYYKEYNSVQDYAQDYINSFLRYYKDIDGHQITSAEEFAGILKQEGYYGDSYANYVAAIKAHQGEYAEATHMPAEERSFSKQFNTLFSAYNKHFIPPTSSFSEQLSDIISPNSYAMGGARTWAMAGGGSIVGGGNNTTSYNIRSITVYSSDPREAGDSVINAIRQRCGSRDGGIR